MENAPPAASGDRSKTASIRGMLVIDILYFLFFATFGIFVSFINVYYRKIGLSGVQIGWLNAVIPLVAVLTGPLWGRLLDRTQRVKLLLIVTITGSTLAVLAIPYTQNMAALFGLAAVYSFFNSTMMSFLDTINFQLLGDHPEHYGRQRVWGSIGFILVTWSTGLLFDRIGLVWMFPIYALIDAFLLITCLFLPGRSRAVHPARKGGSMRAILRQPVWLIFTVGLVLLNIGHRGLNFLGVYILDSGGNNDLVGSSASIGAITEIPFMFFSAVLIKKIGLRRMLLGSCLAFALRFFLYTVMPDITWVLPISLLHGLTFGMFWVSAVIAAKSMAPKEMIATSQSLVMVILSLSSIISSAISGGIYDRLGGSALFGVFTVLAVLSFFLLSRIPRFDAPTQ